MSGESEIVVIGLVIGASPNKFNRGEAAAGEGPAPGVVNEEADSKKGVKNKQEAHELMVLFVDVVVPDANNRNKIVEHSNQGVKNEEQEESLVLKAYTVIRK